MDEQQRRLAEELLFSEKKKRSFAKKLYFGLFDSSDVFPFPQVPESEKQSLEELLHKVNEFLNKEVDPDWIDRHAEIPPSVVSGLSQLGVLGMTVPKQYGGLEMSQYSYCRVVEAIAGRCASTALLINAHQSIGLKAVLLFGTELQREKWLSQMAKGEKIAAFSLTEPNAGSDASGIETRAVYDPVKKVYKLNGCKQWTTSGSVAKVLTVMAKTEVDTPEGKQDKVTAFLVTSDMPGFKVVTPALEKVGMRGTRTANLQFTDMEVPEANVLGSVGSGLRVCLTVLDYGRTTFGAMCTGASKFLVEHAVMHATNRYQFKRPLASFGLVKKKLAVMSALTYAMESATYLTAGLIDAGVEDIMLESAMLKVFASEALWQILYDTMQIYGGRSFFTDHPYERMMRDARLNMIGEGSNEVMRAFIGAVGVRDVGLELQTFLEAVKNPIKERKTFTLLFERLLSKIRLPNIKVQASQLQGEAKQLAGAVRQFGFAVVRLLGKYREQIVEKQLELERIADSATALYTAAAVLSRMDSDMSSGIISKKEIEAGKLYCQMAVDIIQNRLTSIFSVQDEKIEALADMMTGVKSI